MPWPCLLLPAYREQLAPDGVNYLSIAQHYAVGRFDVAVNPYWSPLLSWALVSLLWAGVEPLLAAKLVAVAAWIALRALITVLDGSARTRDLLSAAAAPLLLHAALYRSTPTSSRPRC